tara:strand:+ start:552 stop:986 length:435 start_codon:yes stop_codon:yes gene_type:complete
MKALLALQALTAITGMSAARAEAQSAAAQAKSNAANAKLQGEEAHNKRMRDLDVLLSTNNAMAAYMGRDDRSIDAIRRRVQRDAGTDAARLAQNTLANVGTSLLEANVALARGENRARSILLDGLSSGYSNYLRFKDVTPKGEE